MTLRGKRNGVNGKPKQINTTDWTLVCFWRSNLMYFDLNIPVPQVLSVQGNKKGKGKQSDVFTRAQIEDIETRVDLLVHCMFSSSQSNCRVSDRLQ